MAARLHPHSLSLKWRIIGLAFSAVAVLTVAFCLGTYIVVSKAFDRQSTAEIQDRIGAIDHLLNEGGARQLDAAVLFADNPAVAAAVGAHDEATATALADELNRKLGCGEVMIFAADGSLVGRTHSGAEDKVGIPGLQAALAGRSGHGFVSTPDGRLIQYAAAPIPGTMGRATGAVVIGAAPSSNESFVDRVKSLFGAQSSHSRRCEEARRSGDLLPVGRV